MNNTSGYHKLTFVWLLSLIIFGCTTRDNINVQKPNILIHFYHDIDAWEFYDLQEDPSELNNVIDKPEYLEKIEELRTELFRLQEQYNDTTINSKYF